MPKTTPTDRLIAALEDLPAGRARDALIDNARRGYYDEAKRMSSDPRRLLLVQLRDAAGAGRGYSLAVADLALRVSSGEFAPNQTDLLGSKKPDESPGHRR